ncbi:hypothetical protein N7530_002349 [Penicillium desertorum]|uniref:Uncharacterized protein n=1 Tax=Penicillium desertorum TaxID=1303715 RepID=A0A9W9XBV9_9EURO|nr:hypothetical protein N7530_002349 [Penicillium desertorum]
MVTFFRAFCVPPIKRKICEIGRTTFKNANADSLPGVSEGLSLRCASYRFRIDEIVNSRAVIKEYLTNTMNLRKLTNLTDFGRGVDKQLFRRSLSYRYTQIFYAFDDGRSSLHSVGNESACSFWRLLDLSINRFVISSEVKLNLGPHSDVNVLATVEGLKSMIECFIKASKLC